ncbi:hypothetical protein AVEN_13606-1 [Araneus ventricosus]|uniref:Uncharacterized protein n=1 Tax=Araneus ventricosus TaxID=182803 RepID=A0A4Y2PYP9_ARAVE|nr:hypothetical protein AVEN_13606-1 [Araneus ventricosus]
MYIGRLDETAFRGVEKWSKSISLSYISLEFRWHAQLRLLSRGDLVIRFRNRRVPGSKPIPPKINRTWGLLYPKSYVVAKSPQDGVEQKFGDGVPAQCRPSKRHFSIVAKGCPNHHRARTLSATKENTEVPCVNYASRMPSHLDHPDSTCFPRQISLISVHMTYDFEPITIFVTYDMAPDLVSFLFCNELLFLFQNFFYESYPLITESADDLRFSRTVICWVLASLWI